MGFIAVKIAVRLHRNKDKKRVWFGFALLKLVGKDESYMGFRGI